jgi:predicted permease
MSARRDARARRAYRALLRLFPASFRGDYGPEMEDAFAEERRDAVREGRASELRLWGRTLGGILRVAPREHWDILSRDVGYALRTLRRSPVFTTVAILTLAIGIGTNAAVFSFVDALLLRPLPVPNARQLVRVYGTQGGDRFDVVSYPNYVDLRDRVPAFAALAVHRSLDVSFNAGADGAAEPLAGELVSGNYFSTLGVAASRGRVILPDDDRVEGSGAVVVISDALWRRRFGAAPDVVGRTVRLNGATFEIAGIAPEGFSGSFTSFVADLWVPLSMQDALRHRSLSRDRRGWGWLSMTGRLRPGVTIAQAQAQCNEVARRMAAENPRFDEGLGVAVYAAGALPEEMREGAANILLFASIVVALVLVVTCANLAGVMQARVGGRRREMAIRQSLGAGRLRLTRQWLTESFVIAALGGAAGLLVARWTFGTIETLRPSDGRFAAFAPPVAIDGRVLALTASLVLVTGLLFGLWPALAAGRRGLTAALGEGSTRLAGGRRHARVRRTLTAVQVAACLVLLIVAGLLVRSVRHAAAFDTGFDSHGLALLSVDLQRFGYSPERTRTFYDALFARLSALPDVESVSAAVSMPLALGRDRMTFLVDGQAPPEQPDGYSLDYNLIGPRYFETMRIPLVAGRDFGPDDERPGAPPVAIVNETLARKFWPTGSALGHTLSPGPNAPPATIVGVARDLKYYTLAEEPRPYVYGSARQFGQAALTLHVRATGDPARLLPAMRAAATALDPNVTPNVTTFDDLRALPLFPARAMAALASAFGLVVLVLATIGIYGTLATLVADRTHEIGLRMAFGATPRAVFGTVVGQATAMAAFGIVAGLAGAVAAGRALQSYLLGIEPTDPPTYAVVSVAVLALAVLSAYLPARRAARVDPFVALRE